MKDPLAKDRFLGGCRQQWAAVFILAAFVVLMVDQRSDIDPTPYLSFLTFLAPSLIGSLTLSAYNKEQAAKHNAT